MKIFRLFAAAALCLIMPISGCSLPETDEESSAVIIHEAAVTTVQSTKPAETAPKTTAQTSSEKPTTQPAPPSTTAQTTEQTTNAKPTPQTTVQTTTAKPAPQTTKAEPAPQTTTAATTQTAKTTIQTTTQTPPIESEGISTTYVLNTNTKKFHYASCSSVDSMKEEHKVFTNDRERAIADGYKPCGRCKP